MPSSALQQVISIGSLRTAWRAIWNRSRPSSRNTRGIDGESLNDFKTDEKAGLRKLAADLAHGHFIFSPLRPHLIPKPSGKDRLICVPTVRDRIVQRALLDFLTKKYLKKLSNQISYGFVKHRTVQDAAHLACNHRKNFPWVFKTDITSFFDQIDRNLLNTAIKRVVREKTLHPYLIEVAECEVSPPGASAAKRIKALGIKRGRGVRQGMPLSPLFANLMLAEFDKTIVAAGYKAIRYADDLIFFAISESECHDIHALCRERLLDLNLAIPDVGPGSKSQIYPPTEPAEFLGLSLCQQGDKYVLKLMPNQIGKIRAELLQLGSITELLSRGITLANIGPQVHNRAGGYLSAYEACTNIGELENEMTGVTQKVLRRIYMDGLGINLATLSAEARTFLGLV